MKTEQPDNATTVTPAEDEELLKEIRDTYKEYCEEWKAIWEQADLSIQAVSIDGPWTKADRDARKDAKRPCHHFDLLTQNIDQVVGQARMNPVGIECTPMDGDADEKTAEIMEARIRAMDYEHDANSARLTGLENALRQSFGAWKVSTRFKQGSFEQEIITERFSDPRMVIIDPYCKKADWSDQKRSFERQSFTHDEFKKRFKNAKIQSFESDHIAKSEGLVDSKQVWVLIYWKVKEKPLKVFLLDDGSPEGLTVDENKLTENYPDWKVKKGKKGADDTLEFGDGVNAFPILKERTDSVSSVCSYMSNGVEILENNGHKETPWLGSTIPLIFVTGNEKWEDGKRVLDSLICKGIAPQQAYDHAVSAETEALGKIALSPWIGYEEAFDGNEDLWKTAHIIPRSHLPVKSSAESLPGVLLPLPQRTDAEPALQGINLSKSAHQQALQNAIGMASAERREVIAKDASGKALQEVKASIDVGTYHFFDNWHRGIVYEGKIKEELIPKVENTPRPVGLRDKEGNLKTVRLMEDTYKTKDNKERPYSFAKGRHTVTISTGPSHESQRHEAEATAETLLQTPEAAPIWPLAIKLRRLGPIGDQMYDILLATLPPEIQAAYNKDKEQSPETLQVMAQAKKALDEKDMQLQALTTELQEAKFKEAAKVEDNKAKLAIQDRKDAAESERSHEDNDTELAKVTEQTQTQKEIAELRAQVELLIAAHREEMERRKMEQADEHHRVDVAAGIHSQNRDIAAGMHSQEREIETRPEPKSD